MDHDSVVSGECFSDCEIAFTVRPAARNEECPSWTSSEGCSRPPRLLLLQCSAMHVLGLAAALSATTDHGIIVVVFWSSSNRWNQAQGEQYYGPRDSSLVYVSIRLTSASGK